MEPPGIAPCRGPTDHAAVASAGGIDLRLILLAYAGLFTTAFFMIALGIWVST